MAHTRCWRAAAAAVLVLMVAGSATARAEDAAPAYSRKGADTCLGCHDDAPLMGIFRTKHGQPGDPRAPFGHGGLQCEACHGPGDAHAKSKGKQPAGIVDYSRRGLTPSAEQNKRCLGCHETNAAHEFAAGAHAGAEISCADCHRSHAARDPVREVATQAEVCVTCHQSQRGNLQKPSHHPLREGKMACTSCHAPHGSTGPASLIKASVTETCTSCHAEYRGPFLWEHQPVGEDCANCHDAHGSVQPALLKARAPFLCQQCHESRGHPSTLTTPQSPGGSNQFLLGSACINCHSQVHGSNHPSGRALMR